MTELEKDSVREVIRLYKEALTNDTLNESHFELIRGFIAVLRNIIGEK